MKRRLDRLVVERGLAGTLAQAQALIMAGRIIGPDRRLDKAGQLVPDDLPLSLKGRSSAYASRAGDKLASVAAELQLSFAGRTVLDVGSSTGGFTDFVIQGGARRVYCVDVGTAQLAYRLRQDERVSLFERTDIRSASLPELVDMAVIDVSFVSLTKILPAAAAHVRPGGPIVALVKPQFEAPKVVADRFHGVIPLGGEREEILAGLRQWLADNRFQILAEADSGVAGSAGNVERFVVLRLV